MPELGPVMVLGGLLGVLWLALGRPKKCSEHHAHGHGCRRRSRFRYVAAGVFALGALSRLIERIAVVGLVAVCVVCIVMVLLRLARFKRNRSRNRTLRAEST